MIIFKKHKSRSCLQIFFKLGVLQNFAIFTGNDCAGGLRLYFKEAPTQIFTCEYCEMF